MTVDQHHVTDPPVPGGPRQELIQGTLTAGNTETITLDLSYNSKPVITTGGGAGATSEETTVSLEDDDPTSDGSITIRVDGATAEDKEYHVLVTDELGGD